MKSLGPTIAELSCCVCALRCSWLWENRQRCLLMMASVAKKSKQPDLFVLKFRKVDSVVFTYHSVEVWHLHI